MEIIEHFGILSLLPPALTIILALIFKDVILALVVGILSGTILATKGNILSAIGIFADSMADVLADEWNIRIFLFCALLGGLVALLTKTGAAQSFGNWAAGKLKSRRGALLFTFFFGVIIFIDDYFNSLSVGTAMRPVCDRLKISRAKLAYILDSTAAPICIIAPISSWVVTVMSCTRKSQGFSELGISEFDFFLRMIPYNFYVFLTLLMILVVIFFNCDFGPMRRSELRAKKGEGLYDVQTYGKAIDSEEADSINHAHPFDMIIPLLILILSAIISFPVVTWKLAVGKNGLTTFEEAFHSIGLNDAFCNTDASCALMYSIVITILLTTVYFLGRRLMNIRDISESITAGIRSMVPALIILALAWTIGTIIKSSPDEGGVGLASYLAEIVKNYSFPYTLIPVSAFLLSCLIAFSTGTSWGTMAIMIPIVLPIIIAAAEAQHLTGNSLLNAVCFTMSATIGGAIFGDHSSPISDTTILSATGANCPCLEHVATQAPYALTTAISAAVGYSVGCLGGMSLIIGATTALLCFFFLLFLFSRIL
ncbi:MAG: Na+/H+ antiporter NhaC family protein [Planctomycetia bacterium]|nr:Na+/H+ antiporter NhaC family protein [Planctomycetia bacterium]